MNFPDGMRAFETFLFFLHLFLGKCSDKISLLARHITYRSTLICWFAFISAEFPGDRNATAIALALAWVLPNVASSAAFFFGSMHKSSNCLIADIHVGLKNGFSKLSQNDLGCVTCIGLFWNGSSWNGSLGEVQRLFESFCVLQCGAVVFVVIRLHQDSTSATTCVWTSCGSTCAILTRHEH